MGIIEALTLQQLPIMDSGSLVEGMVGGRDKILLVAPQKLGKSILCLQLASCLAGKHDFLGFAVPEYKKILYIAAEGDLEELQSRHRAMLPLFPIKKDMLFFWPLPEHVFNSKEGKAEFLKIGGLYKPDLTIVDPTYMVMSGSMTEDSDVKAFLRVLNEYQMAVDGAMMIIQHTHRPRKTQEGFKIDEKDEAYYGSPFWAAWPKRIITLTRKGQEKSIEFSSENNVRSGELIEPFKMTMVEKFPLLFVRYKEKWTSGMWAVVLGMGEGWFSTPEINKLVGKDVQDDLMKLVGLDLVEKQTEGRVNWYRRLVW